MRKNVTLTEVETGGPDRRADRQWRFQRALRRTESNKLEMQGAVIIIRSVFYDINKYYPQVLLNGY